MSFFNINYFQVGGVFMRPYEIPTPSSYSNIKLFGGGKFGTLYGERRKYSQTDIETIDTKVEQEWLPYTYINAKFNSNLQGGNITSLPSPIDGWILRRKESGEAKFTTIDTLGADVSSYEDRLVRSKQSYVYELIPKAGDVLGAPLQSDSVTTDFRTVILLDPLTNEGYSFCLNLQVDSITVNEDVTESNTKGKYNTIIKGNRRFKSSSIGVIAVSSPSTDGSVNQDIDFLDRLEDFISNGNEKIIKYPKGITCRVVTSNMVYTKLGGLDRNGNTIYSISFTWQEVGEL